MVEMARMNEIVADWSEQNLPALHGLTSDPAGLPAGPSED